MIERAFGPFLFGIGIEPNVLDVALSLNGVELWTHAFTPPDATTRLDVEAGGASATGTLTAVFTSATSGQLEGDQLELRAPGFQTSFTGTIGVW
jgi:hypothetical protein